jgi:hypothetical protein
MFVYSFNYSFVVANVFSVIGLNEDDSRAEATGISYRGPCFNPNAFSGVTGRQAARGVGQHWNNRDRPALELGALSLFN